MKLEFVAVLSFVLSVKDIKERLAKFNVKVQVTFSFKNTIGEGGERKGFAIR